MIDPEFAQTVLSALERDDDVSPFVAEYDALAKAFAAASDDPDVATAATELVELVREKGSALSRALGAGDRQQDPGALTLLVTMALSQSKP